MNRIQKPFCIKSVLFLVQVGLYSQKKITSFEKGQEINSIESIAAKRQTLSN